MTARDAGEAAAFSEIANYLGSRFVKTAGEMAELKAALEATAKERDELKAAAELKSEVAPAIQIIDGVTYYVGPDGLAAMGEAGADP